MTFLPLLSNLLPVLSCPISRLLFCLLSLAILLPIFLAFYTHVFSISNTFLYLPSFSSFTCFFHSLLSYSRLQHFNTFNYTLYSTLLLSYLPSLVISPFSCLVCLLLLYLVYPVLHYLLFFCTQAFSISNTFICLL